MRPNRLRDNHAKQCGSINGWLAIPHAFSAETMAHQGWDSLTLDMQHGLIDYAAAVNMLTAIASTDTAALVRVPWLDPGIIMRMLDAGAGGIICPMVNSAADAERFVSAMRYPPLGQRSFGPIRALLHYGADYAEHANRDILALAMIETRQALDNLEQILATPGLDGIYIGPADLSLSLGCTPRFDQEEPVVVQAIAHILERAKAHGLYAGIHNGSAAYARRMLEQGFDLVTIASDARLMAAAAQLALSEVRQARATDAATSY